MHAPLTIHSLKRDDRVAVRYLSKILGFATVARVHRNATVSVVWDRATATVDGAFQDQFNRARDGQRYVSRVDASYCEKIASN